MPYYQSTWTAFLAKKLTPTVKRNYPEWHKNRQRYYFWGLDVDASPVQSRLDHARNALSDYLIPNYQTEPHITLYVCGFLTDIKREIDDYDKSQFNQHLAALKQRNINPFSLSVLGVNSFSTAPFLEIVDNAGTLTTIRSTLNAAGIEQHPLKYLPHVTIGLYSGKGCSEKCKKVITNLTKNTRACRTLTMSVHRITLMSYDARNVGSALHIEHAINLATRPVGHATTHATTTTLLPK